MKPVAILCGGQGTQQAGMFDMVAERPAAQPIFAAAEAVLGRDPRAFLREANDAALHANKAGQILCCVRSLAVWASLDLPREIPIVVAGYSVGEMAAWGCAGLFDPPTLMRAVAARADAMDAAMREPGGLASSTGLRRDRVARLCEDFGLHIAIVIADDRFVVGGTVGGLDPFCAAAMEHGAHRAARMPVRVASHTPLLAEASDTFRAALDRMAVGTALPTGLRLLSGIDGASVYDVRSGLDKLAHQLSQPIEWAACLDACEAACVATVLDLGPGHALAAMATDALPGARVHAVEEFRSIEGGRKWLERGG